MKKQNTLPKFLKNTPEKRGNRRKSTHDLTEKITINLSMVSLNDTSPIPSPRSLAIELSAVDLAKVSNWVSVNNFTSEDIEEIFCTSPLNPDSNWKIFYRLGVPVEFFYEKERKFDLIKVYEIGCVGMAYMQALGFSLQDMLDNFEICVGILENSMTQIFKNHKITKNVLCANFMDKNFIIQNISKPKNIINHFYEGIFDELYKVYEDTDVEIYLVNRKYEILHMINKKIFTLSMLFAFINNIDFINIIGIRCCIRSHKLFR